MRGGVAVLINRGRCFDAGDDSALYTRAYPRVTARLSDFLTDTFISSSSLWHKRLDPTRNGLNVQHILNFEYRFSWNMSL